MTAEGDTNIRVRCVSVRQLLEATQTHTSSVFKIDGNELEEVSLFPETYLVD
jgi:hypothetical protein